MDLASLPRRIRVGCYAYDILLMSAVESTANGRLGECSYLEGYLKVREDLAPQRFVETLLHEIMHAMWHGMALDDDGVGHEDAVSRLAMAWLQVWRDNPRLVAWIETEVAGLRTEG